MSAVESKPTQRVLASNRKAYHDYFIEETYEAGLALTGTEIKSVRAGKVSLREGYAIVEAGEAWLIGVHIAPYEHGGDFNPDSTRKRKLLLHRGEIDRLRGKLHERGLTLVPLRVYLKGNLAKVELGLARGKKLYDKREAIAERDAKRQIERAIRRHPDK
ncbi:MAG: SsrA-binding protein SmpB [Chloroflexi bacterium]|nr:SsrA-binding protein SmpB [Chloroflexota bacterium]